MWSTKQKKIVSASVMGVAVVLYAILVAYLGIFGYNNPDPESCFYIDGVDTTAKTRVAAVNKAVEAEVKVRAGYPIDMAHIFRSWFIWGFWDKICQIGIIALFLPLAFCCKEALVKTALMRVLFSVLQSLSCLSSLLWFILGFYWRFSRAGRVTSGDELKRAPGISDTLWEEGL